MYCLGKKAIAEFFGTATLVFLACGTAIVTQANVVATALAFGLVIVAMAYSIGGISGCHINPAVSLGMLIAKKMTLKEFAVYVVAQIVGAIVGALLLFGILKGTGVKYAIDATNAMVGVGAGGVIASLAIEIVLTFIFVYAILGVTSKEEYSKPAGLVIGLTLTLVHLIGINLTGTSVNPARSIGPALASWIFNGNVVALSQLWIFIVAPLVGGALAAVVFGCLNKDCSNHLAPQQ